MSWKIILTGKAQKQINHLDKTDQLRIEKAVAEKLMINPDYFLEPLTGDFSGYCKFRVGDYRLICSKENEQLTIIIVELGHRREVYKS